MVEKSYGIQKAGSQYSIKSAILCVTNLEEYVL